MVTPVVLKHNYFLHSQQDVFCALISLDGNLVEHQENVLGRWEILVEHKFSLYFRIKKKTNQPTIHTNKQKTYPMSIFKKKHPKIWAVVFWKFFRCRALGHIFGEATLSS